MCGFVIESWDEESAARAERVGRGERGSSMQTSKRGAAAAGSSAAASMREEMRGLRAAAQVPQGRDRAWGRGRLGVLGLRVEIGRVN